MPPRLARLLAALAALALVVGAFAVRGLLAGDDGDDAGPDDRDGGSPGGDLRVLCDADLGEATCAAVGQLDGVEVSRPTPARDALVLLSEPEPDYDAWLTVDPWPGVLEAARQAAGQAPVTGEAVPVASGTLAVLLDPTSDLACADPADWACLTQGVRPPVGLPDPDTAVGAVVLGHAAVGLVGGTDFGIGAVRDDPAVGDVLLDTVGAVPAAQRRATAAQVPALSQPGNLSAAVTLDGLAEATAASNQGRQRGLATLALAPEATVGVVLAPIGDRGADALDTLGDALLDETVREALAGAGWDGGAATTTGLPDPDVLYALLEEIG